MEALNLWTNITHAMRRTRLLFAAGKCIIDICSGRTCAYAAEGK